MWIDPNDLIDNPDNPRADVGNITGLRDSIAELGVLEPLMVFATDDGWMLHAGWRRKHAAIAAKVAAVPCVQAEDADRGMSIAGLVAENEVREGLTTGEKVAAARQLVIEEGWSTARLGRAAGLSRTAAKTLATVARSEVATAVVQRFDVTLDQAVVLAEFQDNDEAVKALTVTAEQSPGRFDHIASRLRQERDYRTSREATEAALTAAGTIPYAPTPHPEAAPLWRLNDEDGNPLDEEAHASCPGHLAVVDDYQPDRVHFRCADPEAHGHVERSTTTSTLTTTPSGGAMTDEQKADRRQVIDNNRAALAAAKVRLAFLAPLLTRKTPPTGTLRFVTQVIINRPDVLDDRTCESVALVPGNEVERGSWNQIPAMDRLMADATDKRLPSVLLTQIAASIEGRIDKTFWRTSSPLHAAYLTFLVSTGYEASDVEQLVIDAAKNMATD